MKRFNGRTILLSSAGALAVGLWAAVMLSAVKLDDLFQTNIEAPIPGTAASAPSGGEAGSVTAIAGAAAPPR